MKTSKRFSDPQSASDVDQEEVLEEEVQETGKEEDQTIGEGMDLEGYAGPKVVQPLTPEALAKFNAAQARTGVIYISRIPPGMRPAKVRHLMSTHGEVGRVYLQQEGVMTSAPCIFLLTDSFLFKTPNVRSSDESTLPPKSHISLKAGSSSRTKKLRDLWPRC